MAGRNDASRAAKARKAVRNPKAAIKKYERTASHASGPLEREREGGRGLAPSQQQKMLQSQNEGLYGDKADAKVTRSKTTPPSSAPSRADTRKDYAHKKDDGPKARTQAKKDTKDAKAGRKAARAAVASSPKISAAEQRSQAVVSGSKSANKMANAAFEKAKSGKTGTKKASGIMRKLGTAVKPSKGGYRNYQDIMRGQ